MRPRPGDITLVVRLTPRGGRDVIDGWATDEAGRRYLRARVSAPPEDGKANAALEKLLADTLKVGRRAVHIVAGETSRIKTVEIDGDAGALMARLEQVGTGK